MYEYKLDIAEPIVDGQKVYIPVAVKCLFNKNASSFFTTADKVGTAIMNAYNSNKVTGNITNEHSSNIAKLIQLLPHLQRLACYNFKISDNDGNKVNMQMDRPRQARSNDIIDVNGAFLKSEGIGILPLQKAELDIRNSILNKQIQEIKLRWNRNPYSYYEYLINGLIEVPYESTRQMRDDTAWFLERYDLYPQHLTLGASNGTVRMVLVYDVNQISRVRKIEVRPNR